MTGISDPSNRSRVLLDQAKAGDRGAFDELVSRYGDRIGGLVHARLGERLRGRIDVADVQQEVLLRAFSSLERFEWEGEDAFFRWLSRIVANVIHESARRERRDLIVPLDAEPQADSPSASRTEQREERFGRLRSALDELKSEHREVILLARVERLPIAEVASRMERSPDAVSQLLRRALRRLREIFPETESLHLPPRSLLEDKPTGESEGESE